MPSLPSRFLPPDFDPARPVAIIAGQRRYPILLHAQLSAAGIPTRLVAFEGETEEALWNTFPDGERIRIKVGQVGHMLKALKKLGAGYAVMAGQITPRRLFKGLHPDLKAIRMLAALKQRNAETIFGALAAEIQKRGIAMLDARAGLDAHLASPGFMVKGKRMPDAESLAFGQQIARDCARLDIGQGVVVARGTVLAVEGFEGTDVMLERAGTFGARDALFVKTVKPRQDYRFDVPVFGLRTLEAMQRAGLHAAALHAEQVIVLDRPQVLDAAKAAGITLLGFTAQTEQAEA
ncbi:MAG: LpxI family protein [Opitutales bacterium]